MVRNQLPAQVAKEGKTRNSNDEVKRLIRQKRSHDSADGTFIIRNFQGLKFKLRSIAVSWADGPNGGSE